MRFFDNAHSGRGEEPGVFGPEGTVPSAGSNIAEGVHRRMTQQDPGKTTLGKGCHISGKLSFDGTVHIEGHVEGEITAKDAVIIGDSAIVNAQVTADSVVITGKVTGDVSTRRHMELKAPGQMFGNISTPSLVMHDGVIFEGRCSMNGSARKDKAHVATPAKKLADGEGIVVPPATTIVTGVQGSKS